MSKEQSSPRRQRTFSSPNTSSSRNLLGRRILQAISSSSSGSAREETEVQLRNEESAIFVCCSRADVISHARGMAMPFEPLSYCTVAVQKRVYAMNCDRMVRGRDSSTLRARLSSQPRLWTRWWQRLLKVHLAERRFRCAPFKLV
eukprot:3536644-Prymnesium_polylepis.1